MRDSRPKVYNTLLVLKSNYLWKNGTKQSPFMPLRRVVKKGIIIAVAVERTGTPWHLSRGERWQLLHKFPSIFQSAEFAFCSFPEILKHERIMLHQNKSTEI